MGSSELITKREPGVIVATICREERLNALNKNIYEELNHLVALLKTDKATRVLIITGLGKAFSVGADLKERQGMNEKDILLRLGFVREVYRCLEMLPQIVIAAINGIALGGGLELALCCDLRIASENAVVGLPEVELAIIPGTGGTQRLPRIVGIAKSLELILLAKRVSAREALGIGLVNAVVGVGQSLNEARNFASKICEAGPLSTREVKNAIRKGMNNNLEVGLQVEAESYRTVLYSKDRLEGLKAFSEKRKPVYRGE